MNAKKKNKKITDTVKNRKLRADEEMFPLKLVRVCFGQTTRTLVKL